MPVMTRAIAPSSTRQATGRANSGRSSRAPQPSAVNQAMLAVTAPAHPGTTRTLASGSDREPATALR